MATLTTSPQIIGRNESGTIRTYLYGWYSNQSGSTCTVHLRLSVINTGATYTGTNKTYIIQLGGYNSGVQSWTYTPLNTNQEYTVAETTWTYSGGDAISASAGFWSYVYGSADVSLSEATYVPTFASAPVGLNAVVNEVYSNGAKITASLSSYGMPLAEPGRFIEAGICKNNAYGNPYRFALAYNVNSSTFTINNSSNTGSPALTIEPNTRYYYGVFADNTQVHASRIVGQFVTLPVTPAFSIVSKTSTSVVIRYTTSADGGYYNKTIQYSLDGTNWTTGVVVSSGTATSGTFTINNLTPGETYNIQTRTVTTAGTVPGQTILLDNKVTKLYGGVDDQSKNTLNLYGSHGKLATTITKLYCSIDDQATLVYQGFGHLKYDDGYGTITYYADSAHTVLAQATIQTEAEYNTLNHQRLNDKITASGLSIETRDVYGVTLSSKPTAIPNNFLADCLSLRELDISQAPITAIGEAFLARCISFNSPFIIPSTVETVGADFMRLCYSFNQPLTLPASIRSIGTSFMHNCLDMTSTIACECPPAASSSYTLSSLTESSDSYRIGIKIAGTYASQWLQAFPNRTVTPYRKLIASNE